MSTIWLLIIIIVGGFILSKFARKRVREGLVIDQDGIRLGTFYSGPYGNITDAITLKSLFSAKTWQKDIHFSGELQLPWADIKSVNFGKYWRWWFIFNAPNHYWGPQIGIIIITGSGAYVKQISPPFGGGYYKEIIKQCQELGKGNLVNQEMQKL